MVREFRRKRASNFSKLIYKYYILAHGNKVYFNIRQYY